MRAGAGLALVTDPPAGYPRALLAQLARLAEASPDREICGLVARRAGGALEAVPLPSTTPRAEARAAFAADPLALLAAVRALEGEGGAVVALYHSHLDAPATLSTADREAATVEGRPLWPDADLLVVAVRGGRTEEILRYRFTAGDFRELSLD